MPVPITATAVSVPSPEATTTSHHLNWKAVTEIVAAIAAFMSATPACVELFRARKAEVSWGLSGDARRQNLLWDRNAKCKKDFALKEADGGIQVASVVCPSGDVLVLGVLPGAAPQYRWVTFSAPPRSQALLDLALPSAHASSLDGWAIAQGSVTVLCQKRLADGRIFQRVQTAQGCFEQIINPNNGKVVSSTPASNCSSTC